MAGKLILIGFLLVAIFLWQCGDEAVNPPLSGPTDSPPPEYSSAEELMIYSTNTFAFKIFREIMKTDATNNIFISPLSISYALGMTYNGANGETELAMREALGYYDLTDEEINTSYKSLTSSLMSLDSAVELEIANSIWYRNTFSVLDEFIAVNQEYFDAEVEALDFGDPGACNKIKAWISDKTHGKIHNGIGCPIPKDVLMYVINAAYFKGSWMHEFDKAKTIEQDFYGEGNVITRCELMMQRNEFRYLFSNDFNAVDLPYGDSGYSMAVFLPGTGKTTEDFINSLSEENWRNLLTDFSTDSVLVGLPKFKITYSIELEDVLSALGMGIAFGDCADFSDIDGVGQIYIDRAAHNCFIQVDEEGTEAAASTVIDLVPICDPGKFICFNRPFVFVIHDNYTGTILFMGRITNPVWENG